MVHHMVDWLLEREKKGNIEKGQSSCGNTEVVYQNTVVQHNQPNNTSTNEKRPIECIGWPGIDSNITMYKHNWLKMVENRERTNREDQQRKEQKNQGKIKGADKEDTTVKQWECNKGEQKCTSATKELPVIQVCLQHMQ